MADEDVRLVAENGLEEAFREIAEAFLNGDQDKLEELRKKAEIVKNRRVEIKAVD